MKKIKRKLKVTTKAKVSRRKLDAAAKADAQRVASLEHFAKRSLAEIGQLRNDLNTMMRMTALMLREKGGVASYPKQEVLDFDFNAQHIRIKFDQEKEVLTACFEEKKAEPQPEVTEATES